MANTRTLSDYKEGNCLHCYTKLQFTLKQRRGEDLIKCSECKKDFPIDDLENFMKSLSDIVEGNCPNCETTLNFDMSERKPNSLIKCAKCKEEFYINEAELPKGKEDEIESIKDVGEDNTIVKKEEKTIKKEKRKKFLTIILIIILPILCCRGWISIAHIAEKEEKEELIIQMEKDKKRQELIDKYGIKLTLETSFEGNNLILTGTVNLLDGAYLVYEIKDGSDSKMKEGQIEVKDKTYREEVEISTFTEDKVNIWIAFQTMTDPEQPDWVIELYGELGEKIIDDNISKIGSTGKRVEIEEDINNVIVEKRWEITKAGQLCKDNPTWTKEECNLVADNKYWVGMHINMLIEIRGNPNHANPSNYGGGVRWQWCWDRYTPSCFYGGEYGIITGYN